jgi:NTE family protein
MQGIVALLRARGSGVETILPDSNSRTALGSNVMVLLTRPPATRPDYDQGRALAKQLSKF